MKPSLSLALTTLALLTLTSTAPAQVEVVPVQPSLSVAPAPGEHVAEIELAVSRGSVQAYFGSAPSRERVEVGGAEISFKLPSSATVTKLASRDKDSPGSKRVTPDNPWTVRVPFSGSGRYVFNIQEWDDDPVVVGCTLRVDGVVLFSGRGSEEDLDGWAQKVFGPGVRKTGRRELAFIVPIVP